MGVYPELTAPAPPLPLGPGRGRARPRPRSGQVTRRPGGSPGAPLLLYHSREAKTLQPSQGHCPRWPSPRQARHSRRGRPLVGRLGLPVTPALCRTLTLPASDPSLDSAHAVAPARTRPRAGPVQTESGVCGGQRAGQVLSSRPPADTQGSPLPHTGALPARSSPGSGSHARAPVRIPEGAPPHSPPAPISTLSQVGLVSAPNPHSGVDTRGGQRGARARKGDRRGAVLQHDGALRGQHLWGPGCPTPGTASLLACAFIRPFSLHSSGTRHVIPSAAGRSPGAGEAEGGSGCPSSRPSSLRAPECCVAGAHRQVWGGAVSPWSLLGK